MMIVEAAGLPSCTITRSISGVKIDFPRPLTPTEIDTIRLGLKKIQHAGADEYDPTRIRNFTPGQIDSWVDSNVVDLDSAKGALKKFGRAILFLYQKEEVDVIG